MNKACIFVVIALFLCLFSMPYAYYVFVRFITMALFAILAFKFYHEKNEALAIASVATAILFQPFVNIALGRGMWNIVDVVVGVALIKFRKLPYLNPDENTGSEALAELSRLISLM